MKSDIEANEKICASMRPGLHGQIKKLCKENGIKMEFAYTTGMSNWVAGMNGAGGYRPIYQPDHNDLERILLQGRPEAVEAVRAVLRAFTAELD